MESREFPFTLCPPYYTHNLPTINMPHYDGTFVTNQESTLTYLGSLLNKKVFSLKGCTGYTSVVLEPKIRVLL